MRHKRSSELKKEALPTLGTPVSKTELEGAHTMCQSELKAILLSVCDACCQVCSGEERRVGRILGDHSAAKLEALALLPSPDQLLGKHEQQCCTWLADEC
jgi:hypothetical protein